MDTQTLTLTEFLLARIAEDEQKAKKAGWGYGSKWRSEIDSAEDWAVVHADGKRDMVGCEDGDVTDHIACHDPARVLAECEAKRRIVERLALVQEGDTTEHAWHEQGLFEAVGFLATVYADHPDYREEWRG